MLIDRAVIEVRAGKGGNGAISFRHEKYVEFGGPDGGNGGEGGSVILVASNQCSTLFGYRHGKALMAEDGGKGDKKLMHGKNGKDYIGEVPPGTAVYEESSGALIADLKNPGDKAVVARGGKGGKGNAMFKSSRNRVPRIAENGEPGECRRLILEMKMLSDVGIVGLPSAGKSTLLNLISNAGAKTGDYPFTTLVPNLGVVGYEDGSSLVFGDMPGLVEGASTGKGLGLTFLRHIERTRVLVHLVSMEEGHDPYEDYLNIRKELECYGADLEKRPEIVVASKMDEDGAEERKKEFEEKLEKKVIGLSSYTREGVDEILAKARELAAITPSFALKGSKEEEGGLKVYDAHNKEEAFVITHPKSDLFVISGEEVLRKYASINMSTEEGVARLLGYLHRLGIEKALVAKGIKEGDTVQIGDFQFTYTE